VVPTTIKGPMILKKPRMKQLVEINMGEAAQLATDTG
jgi:hypothetical protein